MPGADSDRDQVFARHSRPFTAFGERGLGRTRIQGNQVNEMKAEGILSLLKHSFLAQRTWGPAHGFLALGGQGEDLKVALDAPATPTRGSVPRASDGVPCAQRLQVLNHMSSTLRQVQKN